MVWKSLILENATRYCEHEKQTGFHGADVPLGKRGSVIARPITGSGCVCVVPKQGKEMQKIHPNTNVF